MNMYDIITKKKHGEALSTEEIEYFVNGYTNGSIPDYQASALLMAICLKLMKREETTDLARAMMFSGDVLDLKNISGIKVDKHSTGGVGDKTSLVLAPMLAASGLTVAKMSGRALGHTGGTIDKLESIPGFRTELSEEEFLTTVNTHKMVIAAQTKDIAPADKKLYALRDVTATVDNISLIASSIMSKKLACGAEAIVLDVKTGSGSLAGSYKNSLALAQEMVHIGKSMDRKICAVISDMNQPLGFAVGNALEVKEAVEALKGAGPKDLMDLCLTLGSSLMMICGISQTQQEAEIMLRQTIETGAAFNKFKEFITAQGGDVAAIENTSLLPQARYQMNVTADNSGYVNEIACAEIGMASLISGAGREVKDAPVDFGAGIMIHKKIGDRVKNGEALACVYASDETKLKPAAERIKNAYIIKESTPEIPALIHNIIR